MIKDLQTDFRALWDFVYCFLRRHLFRGIERLIVTQETEFQHQGSTCAELVEPWAWWRGPIKSPAIVFADIQGKVIAGDENNKAAVGKMFCMKDTEEDTEGDQQH